MKHQMTRFFPSARRLALVAPMVLCGSAGWILWPPAVSSHATLTTTVQFDREIVRILDQHCAMCHMDDGPAFPLLTYEQTWLRRQDIYAAVIGRHMPPWAAFAGYGEFANDNRLTLRETQFVVSWVEGLGPRNSGRVFTNVIDTNAKQREEIRAETYFDHWHLGQPDLTLSLTPGTIQPSPAGAEQTNEVRRVVIDTGLTSERWLHSLEFRPSDRRVLSAAFFTVQETGQWIGSWTPWYGYAILPDGVAHRLPPGAHIMAEFHYRPVNEPIVEQGMLGLTFADAAGNPPARTVDIVLNAESEFPGGPNLREVRASAWMAQDTELLALLPELRNGIQSLEVSARTLDGATQILLFAKDIPMEWPTPYILKTPIELPKGTELSVVAYYAPSDEPSTEQIRTLASASAR